MTEKETPLWREGYRAGASGVSFRGFRPRTTDPEARRVLRNGWINGRAAWRKKNPPVPLSERRLDQRYLKKLCDVVNAELDRRGIPAVNIDVCRIVLERHSAGR